MAVCSQNEVFATRNALSRLDACNISVDVQNLSRCAMEPRVRCVQKPNAFVMVQDTVFLVVVISDPLSIHIQQGDHTFDRNDSIKNNYFIIFVK